MSYLSIGQRPSPNVGQVSDPEIGLKHKPAFNTFIACIEYQDVTEILDMVTREVDGQEIGDYQGAKALESLDPRYLIAPFEHCKSLEQLKAAIEKYIVFQSGFQAHKIPVETRLSNLSYTPHDPVPRPAADDPAPAQAYIAVMFVNGLESSLLLPVTFELPLYQQLEVHDVREQLLLHFDEHLPETTRVQLLGPLSATPLTLQLQVMPQGQEHGKLYIWQSGQLSQFLSAQYVASNDRRLYLEAHLVQAAGSNIRKDQILNLSGPNTIDSSEGDDFDNGYLLTLDDESLSGTSSGGTPNRDTSAPRGGDAPRVECLPPVQRNAEPACSVAVTIDTTNLPDPNFGAVCHLTYRIPLEATPHNLSTTVLRHACEHFRRSHKEMMLALKSIGKGLHMRSFASFHDDRDSYLNRDHNQICRIAKLGDLFLSRKSLKSHPEIPIVIKIDIIDLDPEKDFDSADYDVPSKVFAYHHVATSPVQTSPVKRLKLKIENLPTFGPEEEVQLKPLEFHHLMRYARAFPLGGPVIGVPCREVNGILIGDTRYADEHPEMEDRFYIEKYRVIEDNERRRLTILGDLFSETHVDGVRDGVPMSPSLTFLPFVGSGVEQRAEWLHVALTLINSLRDGKVAIPMGVSVRVWDGEGTREAICEALNAKLREFYTEKASHSGLRMITEGKWHWDLWILPQKVESKHEMVMYRFREESLRLFLDKDMVKQGARTLYMEAHMVEPLDGVL